jgi:hypothetical protein
MPSYALPGIHSARVHALLLQEPLWQQVPSHPHHHDAVKNVIGTVKAYASKKSR